VRANGTRVTSTPHDPHQHCVTTAEAIRTRGVIVAIGVGLIAVNDELTAIVQPHAIHEEDNRVHETLRGWGHRKRHGDRGRFITWVGQWAIARCQNIWCRGGGERQVKGQSGQAGRGRHQTKKKKHQTPRKGSGTVFVCVQCVWSLGYGGGGEAPHHS
jgi:hypothetical protein